MSGRARDYDRTPAARSIKRDWPWVTIVLVAINVGVFAWELAAGADPVMPTPHWMADHGGNFGALTLGENEPWRLLTSMFLHYGVLHLGMNMVGLILFGIRVEKFYGRAGFTALYLVAGLAGSLASALRSTSVVSAGASGAIFGVFGAFGVYLLLHRNRLDRQFVSQSGTRLIILLAANLALGVKANGIDLVAHMGGLVLGFLAGLALEYGTDEGQSTLKRSLAVGVLGTALTFGATQVVSAPRNVELEVRNRVHDVDVLVTEKMKAFNDPAMTDDKARHVIDDEVLPAIHEVRQAYERDGDGPDASDIRRYLKLREEAFTALSKAIRDNDPEAKKQAETKFEEAGGLVEAINKRNAPAE